MLVSGCITIGPRIKTEFVIVRLGNPVQVLDNKVVRCRRVGDKSIGEQDIGGWYAMPEDSFNRMMKLATIGKKYEKEEKREKEEGNP